MVAHKRINILFVHANNYDIGGADYCLLKLAAGLSCSRFNSLVLLGMKTEIADKYREYGIPVMIMPMYRIRKIKEPLYQLKFVLNFLPTVLKIVSLIKKNRIDIVHSNDFLDIYGPIAARLAGVKSIQHDRLIMRRPSWLKELFCFIIKTLNHRIAVVSDGVGREMFSRNGKVHPKVVTCYDWIDMEIVGHSEGHSEFRRVIGVSEEHVLIGAVGRLEPMKGQHVFINAAAQVANKFPYARFIIVGGKVYGRGREKYEEELQYLSSELRLDERVIFAGYRKDISNVMSALDICVLSSVEPDSLPGVVMEAMAMCKPVIGPRAGGVPEQIVNETTGLLYEPGSHQSMAKAICQLIAEPELAKAFGAAGKQRVENVFNKDVLSWQMENIYEDMLND